MENKLPLHGTGVYYFALTGAKEQAIFHSVFEYEYAVKALSSLPKTRLLAYVLSDSQVQFVLRIERDFEEVLDDVRNAFETIRERCWNKRRQVFAEQSTVLLIDEQAYLADLVMQMHDWPRYTHRVADATLWPWSSDKWYREPNPPAWIDTESALNLLCNGRRNRCQHYEAVMTNPIGEKNDLRHGNNSDYFALARDVFVERFIRQEALAQAAYTNTEIQRLFDDASQLVARQFSLDVSDLRDQTKRCRFHHLMPLVVWLLRERDVPLDDISKLVDEDEVRLELWLRNLPADHTDNIRSQLIQRWLPNKAATTA